MRFARLFVLLSLAAYAGSLVGCSDATHSKGKPGAKKPGGHGHEEGHEHHHHGPHDGHLAEFGNHKYHVEWTHEDASGKVNLYLLDKNGKKEVEAAMEKLTLATKTPDEAKEYVLAAVEPVDGRSARFEVVDKDLVTVLESLGKEITAEITTVSIDGEEHKNVKLVEDEEHHHD